MSSDIVLPPDAPAARLCHIRKRSDYAGYGFNLHADKGAAGQYIGKVEEGSPAESAGLREGDRIVEVNGANVCNESHQQVVQRIKDEENETVFLVVDEETWAYYKERDITITSSLPNLLKLETPVEGARRDAPEVSTHPHKARQCHLRIWPDFSGYGFNLHVNKGSQLHFIGKVDEGSPAMSAGLRENDVLVEVNDKNVQSMSHADVVKIVKEDPGVVTLLVVDDEASDYFKKYRIPVSYTSDFVEELFCPDVNPFTAASAPRESDELIEANSVETLPVEVLTASKDEGGEGSRPHQLRLCHIKAWNDGKGFGFNMQSDKKVLGQYIVKVDEGSPAQLAGLLEKDFLVEVNGVSSVDLSHKQVVELIKSNLQEAILLVADPKAKEHFTSEGVNMSSALTCIKTIVTPDSNPTGSQASHDEQKVVVKNENKENETSNYSVVKKELILDVKSIPNSNLYPSQSSPGSPYSPTTVVGGIEFAASAEEARRRMSKKKQANQQMTMQAKYELFQKL